MRALGGRIINGHLHLAGIRFQAPPPKLIGKIPPYPIVTRFMRWALDNLPGAILRPFVISFLTTILVPSPKLFKNGAILINKNGERFTDELSDPVEDMARQPDQLAYIVLDGKLVEKFTGWPYYVSTAPGVAYASIDDYRRTRKDIFREATTLPELAAKLGVPATALEAAVAQHNAKLGRPRVDVTLRISGFFRDAFPAQIELLDKAIRAVGALDEDDDDNPLAARMRAEAATLAASGIAADDARLMSGHRIFGSKPGAYGAGLQALIDEKIWTDRADLAAAYVTWGAYAYGAKAEGINDERSFTERLRRIEAVVHNQDNREHDLLDSDDYYQFEGGMSAAVEQASGSRPRVYHNDHSRPERPVIRTLEEEVGRVMRSRVVNPKWISGVKRHGYKGAFEIAATVDYMFAFAATTGAVRTHHFDLAFDAFIADEETQHFIAANNPAALKEIAERFREAAARGLWTPRLNSAHHLLEELSR